MCPASLLIFEIRPIFIHPNFYESSISSKCTSKFGKNVSIECIFGIHPNLVRPISVRPNFLSPQSIRPNLDVLDVYTSKKRNTGVRHKVTKPFFTVLLMTGGLRSLIIKQLADIRYHSVSLVWSAGGRY